MLDDLRNSSFGEPQKEPVEVEPEVVEEKAPFLGMTAPQRFVVALMVLFIVCLLGVFALIVFQKIYLPFF